MMRNTYREIIVTVLPPNRNKAKQKQRNGSEPGGPGAVGNLGICGSKLPQIPDYKVSARWPPGPLPFLCFCLALFLFGGKTVTPFFSLAYLRTKAEHNFPWHTHREFISHQTPGLAATTQEQAAGNALPSRRQETRFRSGW